VSVAWLRPKQDTVISYSRIAGNIGAMTTLLQAEPIVVEDVLPLRRSLRVAVVTETFPPEVNGVAATIARVVDGLQTRGHEVQLVRPRQAATEAARKEQQISEVLMRGLPIPRYPQLKMGLPSRRALITLWKNKRPDVVHCRRQRN